jgi:hypothetical protein
MDASQSLSVNRLPSSLNFIVGALLKAEPEPFCAAAPHRHKNDPIPEIYRATVTMDGRQCAVLKKFFELTVGHIFSCGSLDAPELLMHFTHRPAIRRQHPTSAAAGTGSRYICEITMAKVR